MTRSEINRRFYVNHLDEMRARNRGRKRTEAQKARRNQLERGRRRDTAAEYREAITVELLRRDGFDCGVCKASLTGKIHIDHVERGINRIENLRLVHEACNQARNRKYGNAA